MLPPSLPLTPFTSRLELAVLSGSMWCTDCQSAAPPLPSHIPIDFDSPEHYVSTFEPLLFEEARESVRSSYQEAANAGKGWQVEAARCAPAAAAAAGMQAVCISGHASAGTQGGMSHAILCQLQPVLKFGCCAACTTGKGARNPPLHVCGKQVNTSVPRRVLPLLAGYLTRAAAGRR